MTKLDDRTIAKMDVVLEETCRIVPNGGDNKVRTYIAQKLKISAKRGNATLDGLSAVAQSALQELMKRNSAYPPRISANDDWLALPSCRARTLWKLWMLRWKARMRKLRASSSERPRDTYWFYERAPPVSCSPMTSLLKTIRNLENSLICAIDQSCTLAFKKGV
jgi:hypothetical protein